MDKLLRGCAVVASLTMKVCNMGTQRQSEDPCAESLIQIDTNQAEGRTLVIRVIKARVQSKRQIQETDVIHISPILNN